VGALSTIRGLGITANLYLEDVERCTKVGQEEIVEDLRTVRLRIKGEEDGCNRRGRRGGRRGGGTG
jgi:hypothetical protein